MATGARTFSLEDTLLEPQVLEPPPTRHALLAVLLALAAVLHLATAGWGDLSNGVEGQYAGGAREMLESRQWLVPTNNGVPSLQTPPLVCWLVIISYKIFGVTATATRIPIAFAMIASIGLTFLIGERLAGYWRGFAAGLIHLCSAGAFLLGRMVMPEPVFSAFIAGAFLCLVCGFQRRRFRRAWFAGVWLCAGFACLAKGLSGLFYLAAVCILLAIFFREARLRFKLLLHWSYLLPFVLLVAPWFTWAELHFAGAFVRSLATPEESGMPRGQFLLLQAGWLFPTAIVILPGLLFATRRIIRPNEMAFADALPLCWMAVGLLPPLLLGEAPAYASMSMWSAFAVWAALVWERTPRVLRAAGIGFLLLAGAVLAGVALFIPETLGEIALWGIPASSWIALRALFQIAGLVLVAFAMGAIYFVLKQRPEIALVLVLTSMIPFGLCLAESVSRLSPFFSLAQAAHFLNPRLVQNGQVLYEGSLQSGSSLTFYLNKKFFLVGETPDSFAQNEVARQKYLDEHFVLDAWTRSDPIFFIIDEDRMVHWKKLVTARVHIYHQVTTCGRHVVLSNQL